MQVAKPYEEAAVPIQESGLGWPLPLPPGQKHTPPTGYTGHDGDEPDEETVATWAADQAAGNVCIRLAADVVGIDVDAYKDGVFDTLAGLERAHGPLPQTWGSSSKLDGVSGIWLYLVEPDASRDAHGIVAPGIETIRYSHRYVVAPPSVHPDGNRYVWRVGPDQQVGRVADSPPRREHLARLPDAWVAHLVLGDKCPCGYGGAIPKPRPVMSGGSWEDQYVPPSSLRGRTGEEWFNEAMATLAEPRSAVSRHDLVLRAVQVLCRDEAEGDAAESQLAEERLEELQAAFIKSVTEDGTRSQREASQEWERMVSGGWRNVASVMPGPKAPDDPWEAIPLASFQHLADEPIPWMIEGFLVDGTYGVVGGSEKSLKSQIGYHLAVSVSSGESLFGHYEVKRPGPVLIYSGEGGRRLLARRMTRVARAYGVNPSTIAPDILVMDRPGRMTDARFLKGLARNLQRLDPVLVLIDPAYSYMGGNLEAGNVFEMGEVLARVTTLVRDYSDASLLVTHHATKVTGTKEMTLAALSQAGFREWVDSWVLLWHRDDPNVSAGSFKLRAKVGSRQWGESVLDIDYEDGVLDLTSGRFSKDPSWTITDVGHSALQRTGRPGASETDIKAEVIALLSDEPWAHTRQSLVEKCSGSAKRIREAVENMEQAGLIEFAVAQRKNKRDQLRPVKVAGITQSAYQDWSRDGSRKLKAVLAPLWASPPSPDQEV